MMGSMMRRAMLGDGSTLNLDFTTMTATADLTARGLTFTRGSTGTRINASGFVETMSNNVARFDHDPTTQAPRGLLVEGQATNLLNWSESFATSGGTNNNWADTSITRTTGQADPANGTTAIQFTASAGNATVISSASIGTSAARTFSVWLRRVTGTGNIQYTQNNGTNWTTQVITATWTRYTFTHTVDHRVGIRIVTSGDAIEMWGAMLETGSGASSYISTGASQATRVADNCYADSISSWYTQGSGTMLFFGRPTVASTRTMLTFSVGTNVPRIQMYGSTSTDVTCYLENPSGTGANIVFPSGTLVNGTAFKSAWAFETANHAACINAGTVATASTSSPAVPSSGITRLNIGMRYDGFNQFNGHVISVKYWPTRLANATLQAITTL